MSEDAIVREGSTLSGFPVFAGTIAAVLLSIIAFLFFDLSLASIDRRESAAHAASSYENGLALLRSHDANAAIDEFRVAVQLDRTNVSYALALSEALLEANRASDAESTLKALLTRTENEGAVNLTMAHVMVREGRLNDAKAYFHRAIFGRWGVDSVSRRTTARFELIQLLTEHGSPAELLAELLPFEDISSDSVALRRRLGHLFLLAGSPARAANMFRSVLRKGAGDGDAYAGLGEAALALGNFRIARADFAEAAARLPDDPHLSDRIALIDSIVALDPAANGLSAAERYARSRTLLTRTVDALSRCGEDPTADMTRAKDLLSLPARPARRAADGDAMVAASIALWNDRPRPCDAATRDEALRAILGLLAG